MSGLRQMVCSRACGGGAKAGPDTPPAMLTCIGCEAPLVDAPTERPSGRRVVHCKRGRHDVYIGRPSKWGNPFPVPSKNYDRIADPARILERYEKYVRSRPDLMAALPELRGKVLGCWCAPHRCHGDVLVKLVDELDAAEGT